MSTDLKRRQEFAAIWRMLGWSPAGAMLEQFPCGGCVAMEHCSLGIKECAETKDIDSCGRCAEHPCEKLEKTFEKNKLESLSCQQVLSANDYKLFEKAFFTKREKLDEIRRSNAIIIENATLADAEEILELQKLAFTSVGDMYNNYTIPPLIQTLEEIRAQFNTHVFLKMVIGSRIIGSVRGYAKDGTCFIGRLVVHPDFENRGIGSRLMQAIEAEFPQAKRYELFTGHRSERNLYLYKKLGYTIFKNAFIDEGLSEVFMEKMNHA